MAVVVVMVVVMVVVVVVEKSLEALQSMPYWETCLLLLDELILTPFFVLLLQSIFLYRHTKHQAIVATELDALFRLKEPSSGSTLIPNYFHVLIQSLLFSGEGDLDCTTRDGFEVKLHPFVNGKDNFRRGVASKQPPEAHGARTGTHNPQ